GSARRAWSACTGAWPPIRPPPRSPGWTRRCAPPSARTWPTWWTTGTTSWPTRSSDARARASSARPVRRARGGRLAWSARPILLVTNDFPPRAGGIQAYLAELAGRLPAGEVVVYAPAWPGAEEHDAALPYPVHRHPGPLMLPVPSVA